jgi:NAD(P)-dependent dehydrogenase (short-subunit alcohol dehydrogenase family)
MPVSTTEKSHAGRVAIVTGAARGIGQAIAVGLATQGATLVVGDVGDLADTTKLIAEADGRALAVPLDPHLARRHRRVRHRSLLVAGSSRVLRRVGVRVADPPRASWCAREPAGG